MRLKKRLLALALAVLLLLPGVLLSPALPIAAQTTSDLYGYGSADEINIVKLLDMALNKCGMSMSPATIKAFLEYWWSSVNSDLSTCISNADSAITTTQAFADYLISALENADHYDKLGSITQQYVRFVLTLDAKSVSDFKQLLTQQGTFRRFLLSYVTDEDGNIAGTVDNKIKRYNLKGGFVDMTRKAADLYIEEYEGYFLVPTTKVSDILPTWFSTKSQYDDFCDMVNHNLDIGFYGCFMNYSYNKYYYYVMDFNNSFFVGSIPELDSTTIKLGIYNSDWEAISYYKITDTPFYYDSSDDLSVLNKSGHSNYNVYLLPEYDRIGYLSGSTFYFRIYSKDGASFKVWKSVDQYKLYSVGKSNIYYSNAYSSYDASVDNSIEFSGSYYNSSNTTYSHDVIQNSIDNSSEVNESTVNNIVNNYITNNNYGDSSGGSGSGSSSGSGDWWNIGSGLESFIKGVAALLDFALKLLGDLIALLSTFATSVLDLFKSLALIGSEFGDFLAEVFPFLPPECINIIIGSIGGMCFVGVVKIFKK